MSKKKDIWKYLWFSQKENWFFDKQQQKSEIYSKKGRIIPEIISRDDQIIAKNEGDRCLECSFICNKCVDVCPNRANIAISVDKNDDFSDNWQILHLDAYCNECGNCATFCPYAGKPYKDKLTLFSSDEDFNNSTNSGFIVTGSLDNQIITLRLSDNLWTLKLDKYGKLIPLDFKYPKDYNVKEFKKISIIISTVLKKYSYLINSSMS